MGRNHYETLGVAKHATAEEVKQAFTRLARELHPDAVHNNQNRSSSSSGSSSSSESSSSSSSTTTTHSAERFIRVKEAFDILRHPEKRAAYDKEIAHFTAMGYDEEALRKRAEEFRRNYQRELTT